MEINEEINEANEGFTNQLQKPKKPRTEKQKEALKKAQLKRKENLEKRRLEKEALKNQQINPSLNGMNEGYEEIKEENLECDKVGRPPPNSLNQVFVDDPEYKEWLRQKALASVSPINANGTTAKKPPRRKKKVVVQEPDDSSSEEEIIYIPKKSKKKKKKKVIRHETSSEEEEEETYEPEPQTYQPNRPLRYSDVFNF